MGFHSQILFQLYLRRGFALAAILAVGLIATQSCAPKKTQAEYQAQCAIENNQLATLNGRWKGLSLPIPLAVRDGHFNEEEIASIQAAVEVWNKFFKKTRKDKAFEFGTPESPRVSNQDKPIAACNSTLLADDGTFSKDVVIYKLGNWPHKQLPDAIAVTELCKNRTSKMLIPALYFGSIDVNFQNFFVEGKPNPDLMTNIVHELGHVLGLEHSCISGKGSDKFISCGEESLPPDYAEAVMYPFDQSSGGVLKRKLKRNDQYRSNCLYGETAYPWEQEPKSGSGTGSNTSGTGSSGSGSGSGSSQD